MEENASSSLCIVLKDCKNRELENGMTRSRALAIRSVAAEEGFDLGNSGIRLEDTKEYSNKLVSLWILKSCHSSVSSALLEGVKSISHQIDMHIVDYSERGITFTHLMPYILILSIM